MDQERRFGLTTRRTSETANKDTKSKAPKDSLRPHVQMTNTLWKTSREGNYPKAYSKTTTPLLGNPRARVILVTRLTRNELIRTPNMNQPTQRVPEPVRANLSLKNIKRQILLTNKKPTQDSSMPKLTKGLL